MIIVSFTCDTCGQKINIYENYLENKSGLICPNCSSEFPNTEFLKLKTAVLTISSVKSNLFRSDNLNRPQHSWDFKFEM